MLRFQSIFTVNLPQTNKKEWGTLMQKSKDSKNQSEFKESESIKRNMPDKNLDEGIEHNANKVGLGPNTKR